MKIVVTGYAGFIGSTLARQLINAGHQVVGLDCHTYAARPAYVQEILDENDPRFELALCDLRDQFTLNTLIEEIDPDQVYHLAAESHVCRSIEGPRDFATTNFMGTFNLLEALRRIKFKGRMVHVSTDEAFGELQPGERPFTELTPTDPRSPYSASKAASDLMVRAYVRTYALDCVITRCTNNYGPNQHEEKLIPRAITRFLKNKPMTIHGNGSHIRDWIFVEDHCKALQVAMRRGVMGDLYCIGSGLELPNIEVVKRVAIAVESVTGQRVDLKLNFTNDRPTDDHRYAVDNRKLVALGWGVDPGAAYFRARLSETVEWYMRNPCEE